MKHILHLLAVISFLLAGQGEAFAQGTAFSYQGQLADAGNPATGTYDLQFTLFNTDSGGSPVTAPLTNSPVSVSNGLFVVKLDFGNGVFTGADRWLELGVRTNGATEDFTVLSPRQQVLAVPYAILAGNISGVVSPSSLSGTYSGPVIFSNPSNSFIGDGSGLTNVAGVRVTAGSSAGRL